MKSLDQFRQYRRIDLELMSGSQGNHPREGIFEVPSKLDGKPIRVVLSREDYGWDHVSVSRTNRCPNWQEMEQIRRMFFEDHEAVMQYHAPVAEYVDGSYLGHPYCLHLWRPCNQEIPKPPRWMVGGMSKADAIKASRE